MGLLHRLDLLLLEVLRLLHLLHIGHLVSVHHQLLIGRRVLRLLLLRLGMMALALRRLCVDGLRVDMSCHGLRLHLLHAIHMIRLDVHGLAIRHVRL